jgi:hypothetical protein
MVGPGETLGSPWPPLAIRPRFSGEFCVNDFSRTWKISCLDAFYEFVEFVIFMECLKCLKIVFISFASEKSG